MGAYSNDISVGVIGTGGMGTRHAETLSSVVSGARVAGVTDLDRSRAEKLAVSCGSDATVFLQDEQSLIQDDGIDAASSRPRTIPTPGWSWSASGAASRSSVRSPSPSQWKTRAGSSRPRPSWVESWSRSGS